MSLNQNDLDSLQGILAAHECRADRLLQILREVQQQFRHIPRDVMDWLAAELGVSLGQIQGVTEFYTFLSTEPQGRFHLLISDSISDHLLGSREIGAYLGEKLGVPAGVTRVDGKVSWDYTSCTGLCDQGPAGLVNGIPLTRLDRKRIDGLVECVEAEIPLRNWPRAWFTVQDQIRRTGLLLQNPVKPGTALRWSHNRGLEGTLQELEKSGLRGRGGAGFPTGRKWRFCREASPHGATTQRYVVCNADEGEPGTFKDRVLLQRNAKQVFEGMALCAMLIGANQGFVYLRGEYEYLKPYLEAELRSLRQNQILGKNILGQPGFDFDIEIHLGAGAYICGEESALIESLEGKRGVPRNRPPYPVTSGYLGAPTVVNNVETFAAAAAIAVRGSKWFTSHGTEKSAGSKILSICGDCLRTGIYEYDFGTPIRQILQDAGARDTLGIQVGGPSGTFIGEQEFDRILGFEDLPTGGSFMIFQRGRDVLEIARNFTHFFAHESCGFCTPCRVGTTLLSNQLDKICSGHASSGDLQELENISQLIHGASHCGLGQTASNPVLDTLKRFPEVYQARLRTTGFEPGFDLDGELSTARRLSGRDDALAHLEQVSP